MNYPKIKRANDSTMAGLLLDGVIVEEKIDGSQFAFGVTEVGDFWCRSKGAKIDLDAPPKLFLGAAATARSLYRQDRLIPGYAYRGEALQAPRHNVLAYDRIPEGNFILFDVQRADGSYLHRRHKEAVASGLGLEVVPLLFEGRVQELAQLEYLLEWPSVLRGQQVEGIVIKNYRRTTRAGEPLFAKIVSAKFREMHDAKRTPRSDSEDPIERIIAQYACEPRWQKALQHLREQDALPEGLAAIGPLMGEASKDFQAECSEEIKEALWQAFRKRIIKGVVQGLPAWYRKAYDD